MILVKIIIVHQKHFIYKPNILLDTKVDTDILKYTFKTLCFIYAKD